MWTRRSRRPRPGALCCRKRNDGHLPHRTCCFQRFYHGKCRRTPELQHVLSAGHARPVSSRSSNSSGTGSCPAPAAISSSPGWPARSSSRSITGVSSFVNVETCLRVCYSNPTDQNPCPRMRHPHNNYGPPREIAHNHSVQIISINSDGLQGMKTSLFCPVDGCINGPILICRRTIVYTRLNILTEHFTVI